MTCIGGLAALLLNFTALIASAEVLMEGRSNLLSAVDHAQALTHRHMRVAMPSIDPPRVSGPTKGEGRGSARGPEEKILVERFDIEPFSDFSAK